MRKFTTFKLFVANQDEALRFYAETLGFSVAEDRRMGDFRWLLVQPPDTADVALNLDLARTPEQKALVGKQAGDQPFFGLATDNCIRDYEELKRRGVQFDGAPQVMPYGTGVTMRDLYGNRIYLNQDREE